jgi:hypothetical protein
LSAPEPLDRSCARLLACSLARLPARLWQSQVSAIGGRVQSMQSKPNKNIDVRSRRTPPQAWNACVSERQVRNKKIYNCW